MKHIFTLICFCLLSVIAKANIIYVNQTANGSNDGSSWSNAYTNLNDATNIAVAGDSILIAAGTYYPEVNGGFTYAAFLLAPGVELYGGFPASGTPTFNDRDWENHLSILEGDTNGDDSGSLNRSDNAKRIMVTDSWFLIDGLIIRNGGDDSGAPGAGIALSGATERHGIIKNCTFSMNWVTTSSVVASEGGAIRGSAVNDSDSLILDNCVFLNNAAMQGGAVLFNGRCKATNCKFLYNVGARGTAVTAYLPSNGTSTTASEFTNCVFFKNIAIEYGLNSVTSGGTILRYNDHLGELRFTNCTFKDNLSHQTTPSHKANILTNYESFDYTETYFDNCLFDVNASKNFKSSNNSDLYFRSCIYNGDVSSFFDVSQSIVDGNTLFGNFVYSTADTINGIFILDCSSAGIDAGNNSYVVNANEDLAGNPRLSGASVDVGAFETQQNFNADISVNGNVLSVIQSGYTYQWIDCDNGNTPINGETNQSFTVTSTGNYACAIDNGCYLDTTACQFINPNASIQEEEENAVLVFPNPASDFIQLKAKQNINSILIRNLDGKTLYQDNPTTELIDISQISPGIYILEIRTEKTSFRQQLLVQ